MTPPHIYVRRHCPLITPRIEFQIAPRPELPLITPRIDFGYLQLVSDVETPRSSPLHDDPPDTQRTIRAAHFNTQVRAQSLEPAAVSRMTRSRKPLERQRSQTVPPSSGPSAVNAMIPKPNGEPGRPGSGGFCLSTALLEKGWRQDDIDSLLAKVKDAVEQSLDPKRCFRDQNTKKIQQICDQMMEEGRWSILRKYVDCWPVRSALKAHLKYTSEAYRRAQNKNTAQRLRNAFHEEEDE